MNLADIRKKAILERDSRKDNLSEPVKPVEVDVPSAPEPDFVPVAAETAMEHSSTVSSPDDFEPLPDFDEDMAEPEPKPEPEPEHFPAPAPEQTPPPPLTQSQSPAPEPPVIAVPAIPASTAVDFSANAPQPPGGEGAGQPVVATEAFRGTLAGVCFNPLAVLMAGREAAGLDNDLSPEPSSEQEEVLETGYQEFLCFRVAAEEYAVNIMEIKEIIKPRETTEVPRVPDFISGVLSLRGIIIPIFDMKRRLHLASSGPGGKERIIVVSRGDELFGIQVDEVLQVVRISESLIEPPPAVLEGIDRDFVMGIGRHDSRMLIMLNLAKILNINLF